MARRRSATRTRTSSGPVALVHNGIIENFKPLRDELIAEGRKFESETDTEVVGHLVAREIERGASPEDAVAAVLPRLTGAFAIAFLFRDHPDLIIGARMGAPLTVGYGEGENYLGSDALAVAPWTQRIAYLDEGDWAVVRRESIEIFDRDNQPRRARDRRIRRIVGAGREGQLRAITCRRRFSSSRSWLPRLSRPMSGRSKARSRCRSPTPTSSPSTG